MTTRRRFLHFVFKVSNRNETAAFYKDVLGMKVLRHEEFETGCEAACNGPFDGKWSKSMVGYGPEHQHFVLELTYNYGIGAYTLGNDFKNITINSTQVLANAAENNWPLTPCPGGGVLVAPGGYTFIVNNQHSAGDPVQKVTLSSSNIQKSIDFWKNKLDMKIYKQDGTSVLLGYSDDQAKLELVALDEPMDHAKAFGQIAFSCPGDQLSVLENKMRESGETILTPLVSLDTPGKAAVEVIILADPDGHEICFVGDEAFRELSEVDHKADQLLEEALKADKSDEWFAKKGRSKEAV